MITSFASYRRHVVIFLMVRKFFAILQSLLSETALYFNEQRQPIVLSAAALTLFRYRFPFKGSSNFLIRLHFSIFRIYKKAASFFPTYSGPKIIASDVVFNNKYVTHQSR